MSLEKLAELVGTTNQQISYLETGKRRLTVDWLHRLGIALGCHPWALVSEELPSALQPQEVRLLEAFRTLSAEQRQAVLVLTASAGPPGRPPDRSTVKR